MLWIIPGCQLTRLNLSAAAECLPFPMSPENWQRIGGLRPDPLCPLASSFRGWKQGEPPLASLEKDGEGQDLNLHPLLPYKMSDVGNRAS